MRRRERKRKQLTSSSGLSCSISYLFVHLSAIKYQGPIKINHEISGTNQISDEKREQSVLGIK